MKFCKDKQCRRSGELLRLSDFPMNRKLEDQRGIYCKECCCRKERDRRAARGARQYKPRVTAESEPTIEANEFAFSKVYENIAAGPKTREQIHEETGVDYDTLGEIICELVWDCKAVRFQDRQLVMVAA